MLRMGYRVLALLAPMALVIAGCGGSTGSAAPVVSATPTVSADNPYGVLDIDPAESDEAILDVVAANGQSVELSLDALRALGATEVELFEPFIKTRQRFVGVPLSVLLDKAGIPATAQLLTIALNDYRYTAPVADLVASEALVAYQVDGRDIGYNEGGPVRLVFPDGSPQATNLDAWNWSLKELQEQ
jgi:hypothetical protein